MVTNARSSPITRQWRQRPQLDTPSPQGTVTYQRFQLARRTVPGVSVDIPTDSEAHPRQVVLDAFWPHEMIQADNDKAVPVLREH